VAVPLGLFALRGVYPCYYAWMAYIPVCIGLCSTLSARPSHLPGAARNILAPALLGMACVAGLPLVSVVAAVEWADRDCTRIERLVDAELRPADRVYCDAAAYYAVKARAPADVGFRRLREMTPRQRSQISVLVIDPAKLEIVRGHLGGRWQACSEPLRPSRPPLLGTESEYFLDRYSLQVFRRQR